MKLQKWIFLFTGLFFIFTSVTAYSKQSWNSFVQGVRVEALSQGIRPEVFDEAFKNIHQPNSSILHFDHTQPEFRLTFLKYRNTRADHYRIVMGRREMKKYQPVLDQVGRQFGVSPCFIVSLWGLETSYGHYMGTFPVIQSLSTLAYDSSRAPFFRKQLLIALHILNGGHVKLADFKGEWAGASGMPQFMPSSWKRYAVDFNGDGRKDIWTTHSDAFASIANYLKQNGWQTGQPWAIKVSIPSNFPRYLMTRQVTKTVAEWKRMGVQLSRQVDPSLQASIIEPDGGPVFMIFNNFNVIMKWNHSIYYVGTVGWMAEQICRREL